MDQKILPDVSIDTQFVQEKIYIIRGKKVMFDKDLANLYGVPTKSLNQSVKRNIKRFPEDFVFQLTKQEIEMCSRSQIVTLNTSRGSNVKYAPLVFTEQGIAMLSSVLNSDNAILVNIQIIRIFTKLREMIDSYKELREKVEEMERNNESNFKEIFRAIKLLLAQEEKPRKQIGF